MDTSAYTPESVKELEAAIEAARADFANEAQNAKYYYNARNQLEYARAKLVYSTVGEDGPNKLPFRELTTDEVIAEMGAGINLGNTMDGHSSMMPNERAWQPRAMTKEQITSMHNGGYNTIRIPVTWGKKITKDEETGEYIINESWLNRVNEVVDYAIDNGMYVIINIHHDGVNWSKGWFNIGNNDIDAVMEKYAAVWKIIAERFKDYDEHLIFESMNEMTCAQADENKWNGGAYEYDYDILRNFNQLFVNTVRATGSNNTKRWLASKWHFAYTGKTTMPIDPLNDGVSHQMYSAHIYKNVSDRYKAIKEYANNFKEFGCPLILGEWTTYTGDDGSTATGYNDVEKAFQSEMVYKYAKVNNICAVAWDIGVFEKNGRVEGGNASYWSRDDLKPGFQSQLRGVMRGAYLPLTAENQSGNLDNVYEQYSLSSSGVFDSGKPVNSWEGNDIEGVAVSDHTAVFTDIEKPTSVTLTFTITQVMLSDSPVSGYVKNALYQAENLDISSLSEEEAEQFRANIEKLRELMNDESTPEGKLLSCYSKVKTVIDEINAQRAENEKQEESAAESSTPEPESNPQTPESESEEQAQAPAEGGFNPLVIIIPAALVIAAVVIIVLRKSRKK